MKKRIVFLPIIVICILFSSCEDWSLMTCTDGYVACLRIDGNKNQSVIVEYIGPRQRKYESNFNFSPKEVQIPYTKGTWADTKCRGKHFKKNNYNFLHITNKSTDMIYICATISGKETEGNFSFHHNLCDLFAIYHEQDLNPHYDYKKDKNFQGVEYMDRYELYKKLEAEKYPYFIKLPPQKSCIMKWGGYGFVLQ